ncbi:MAG: SLBB domain-containing protein, partial [Gordonia sp. (in: high G+C Gram-positive bacteria)]|uniref:SLBB domain-containing protein n=1 Tax=Gordonia sp. (in: high G+C Gram-positive bacteria) TaxID=84139 RepID=UPI003BB75271
MARRASTTAPSSLDRVLGRSPGRPDALPPSVDRRETVPDPDDWGATVMPSWLDTAAGRSAWAGRRGVSGNGVAPDTDSDSGTDSGTGCADRRAAVDDDEVQPLNWDEVLDDEDGHHSDRTAAGVADDYADDDYADDDYADLAAEPNDHDDEADDDWAAPRRRFAMLPPAAIGLIGIGVIACVIAGFALLSGSEPAVPLVDLPASAGPTAAGPTAAAESAAAPAAAAEIVVSVAGLVHRPGLVTMAPNSRVAQALDLAGGARPNADVLSLNLAQVLRDGDQVLVGTRENGANSVRSAVVASGSAGTAG